MRVKWTGPQLVVLATLRETGTEHEFSDEVGAEMIARGLAERVVPVKDKPARAVPARDEGE